MMYIILLLLLATPAWAFHTPITALGFTQEEINIWVTRASSGPYKTQSDVSTNSPGDWTRILANANTFIASPTAERWTSWDGESGCMDGTVANPGPARHINLMNSAFVYLVTGDTDYLTPVTTELIYHSERPGLDFTDGSLWCADGVAVNPQPIFDAANWLIKLVVAYDFIRSDISAGNRATLDAWYQGMMAHWRDRVDAAFNPGEVWPFYDDRLNGDWNLTATGSTQFNAAITETASEHDETHFGGYIISQGQQAYSNRLGVEVALSGLLGVMYDDATTINSFKSFIKEMLQFVTFPDGTYYEFNRWLATVPPLGLGYSSSHWCYHLLVIEALARHGDRELIDTYSTSNGSGGGNGTTSTTGGPKSVKLVQELFSQLVIPDITRYIPGHDGESNYRIDTEDGVSGEQKAHDIFISLPNLFWRDSSLKDIYMRTAVGAPDYPSAYGGGEKNWGGTQGYIPGFMFMFGDMDGKVFPYEAKGVGVIW